jgi:hypothetical protein
VSAALVIASWLSTLVAPPSTEAARAPAATTADAAATSGVSTALPRLEAGPVRATLSGTIRPAFGLVHRGDADDRDRWSYGADGTRFDLGLDVDAGAGVTALAYVRLTAEDDGDGGTRGTVDVERAVIRWSPIKALRLGLGRDRVPLSAQSATPTSARLFPDRIGLDRTFVLPADVGLHAAVTSPYLTVLGGVWNGVAGDAMLGTSVDERGLLFSARVEVTPLGSFAFDESARPDTVRVGIGAAVTYRAATTYDATGAASARARDLRAAASVRVGWRGLYVQGEVLRKQVTDDLSMRPDVATAAYAQAAWRLNAGSFDIAPIIRAGVVRVRELSAPANGSILEAGVSAFPFARRSDRLQLVLVVARDRDPDLGISERVTGHVRLGF